jgi:hypothetical protein
MGIGMRTDRAARTGGGWRMRCSHSPPDPHSNSHLAARLLAAPHEFEHEVSRNWIGGVGVAAWRATRRPSGAGAVDLNCIYLMPPVPPQPHHVVHRQSGSSSLFVVTDLLRPLPLLATRGVRRGGSSQLGLGLGRVGTPFPLLLLLSSFLSVFFVIYFVLSPFIRHSALGSALGLAPA